MRFCLTFHNPPTFHLDISYIGALSQLIWNTPNKSTQTHMRQASSRIVVWPTFKQKAEERESCSARWLPFSPPRPADRLSQHEDRPLTKSQNFDLKTHTTHIFSEHTNLCYIYYVQINSGLHCSAAKYVWGPWCSTNPQKSGERQEARRGRWRGGEAQRILGRSGSVMKCERRRLAAVLKNNYFGFGFKQLLTARPQQPFLHFLFLISYFGFRQLLTSWPQLFLDFSRKDSTRGNQLIWVNKKCQHNSYQDNKNRTQL